MLPDPVATTTSDVVARPLAVLVPLIQADIRQGQEAAARASLPYYQAAGEKLLEAKSQLQHGEFQDWVRRHFPVKMRMARYYMQLAEATARQNGNALPFSSLKDFIRQTKTPPPPRPTVARQTAAFRTDVAERLITTGYKALALKVHPDIGGTKEEMAQLNAARAHLKQAMTGAPAPARWRPVTVTAAYWDLAELLSKFESLRPATQHKVIQTVEDLLAKLRRKARPVSP